MKITVYTVSDCQFSKAEKEYLTAHNLPYEEKNLEQNREWLTEMLAVSNNFAGTPVTKIEKDDGQIVVLKGFTEEEFDQVLGFKKEEVTQAEANVSNTSPSQPPLPQSTPAPQTTETPSTTQPPPPPPPQTPASIPSDQQPTVTPTPNANPPSPTDPLKSILSNLEKNANPPPASSPSQPSSNNIPNIPDFNE